LCEKEANDVAKFIQLSVAKWDTKPLSPSSQVITQITSHSVLFQKCHLVARFSVIYLGIHTFKLSTFMLVSILIFHFQDSNQAVTHVFW